MTETLELFSQISGLFPDGPARSSRPKQRYAVALGEDVTVPCVASGNPKPDILWSKIGTNAEMDSQHGCLAIAHAEGWIGSSVEFQFQSC